MCGHILTVVNAQYVFQYNRTKAITFTLAIILFLGQGEKPSDAQLQNVVTKYCDYDVQVSVIS